MCGGANSKRYQEHDCASPNATISAVKVLAKTTVMGARECLFDGLIHSPELDDKAKHDNHSDKKGCVHSKLDGVLTQPSRVVDGVKMI